MFMSPWYNREEPTAILSPPAYHALLHLVAEEDVEGDGRDRRERQPGEDRAVFGETHSAKGIDGHGDGQEARLFTIVLANMSSFQVARKPNTAVVTNAGS